MSQSEKATIEDDEPFDPDRRELCPDGLCVGVIGPDGRCKVCGKPGAGGPKPGPAKDRAAGDGPGDGADSRPPDQWRPSAVPGGGTAEPQEREESAASAGGHANWERERVPCPDGMCVGVVGKNGKCGTCGKPWDWKERE
ncbi:MAG: hypothetical protein HY905_17305 [Deltaproteobacteria bacterium]|nr:hypothetical protein [Deltaproteobacteria bacterium]